MATLKTRETTNKYKKFQVSESEDWEQDPVPR